MSVKSYKEALELIGENKAELGRSINVTHGMSQITLI